jgi:LysM repeat protein
MLGRRSGPLLRVNSRRPRTIESVAIDVLSEETEMRRTSPPHWRLLTAAAAVVVACLVSSGTALAQERVHVVGRGENLSTIAQRYGLTTQDLSAHNGIVNPNLVMVGQQLQIPGGGAAPSMLTPAQPGALPGESGYYTVGRGDTLSQIARNHGMTTDDLMRLNSLGNANVIWVGQKLRVSARVAPVVQSAPAAAQPQAAERIYVVKPGDTLSAIAKANQTTVQQLLVANGLPSTSFIYSGQRLRVRPSQAGNALNMVAAPADGKKWIEINLSEQTLTAWQGDVAVMHTFVSTGRSATPTVTGRFTIGTKYNAQRMTGPGYDLPGVPWVMYFFGGYAIHGAYWHTNFGSVQSHGCVNMRVNEAELLYHWAPAGTEVYVHY